MLSRLEETGRLYQADAAQKITEKFGDEFTYLNDNGNPAIDKRILRAFRRISGDSVVWERWDFCWREKQAMRPAANRNDDRVIPAKAA